jgi:hypothetical protein
MEQEVEKLNYSDIAYYGKPIDTLTREELLDAFLEFAQIVYEGAKHGAACKDVFCSRKKIN